ncbi:alkaline phosphatase D family protein [Motiliproteus sediminis]|uniref:alkaline phosphatase D family protein n=1 Tax=Motiliproteus sediminis TaxID=1468178 RepID=UPI001AEFD20B|nr:alkaline phosphatase D family protein [Motiliproteus sediminis]
MAGGPQQTLSQSVEQAGVPLPDLLAGPMLRRVSSDRVALWLAVRAEAEVRVELTAADGARQCYQLQPGDPGLTCLVAGDHLCYLLIDLCLSQPLPPGWTDYRVQLRFASDDGDNDWRELTDCAEALCFEGRKLPGFMLNTRVGSLLHGSCRKPHHPGGDGLAEAERVLAKQLAAGGATAPDQQEWPTLLVLSGDQIYADDVAGPLLRAIHLLKSRLGLYSENLEGLEVVGVADSDQLASDPNSYYRRVNLLPHNLRTEGLIERLFGGVRKPVFTSDNADNHLVSLAEYLLMYLLVWSPAPWRLFDLDEPPGLSPDEVRLYRDERRVIDEFVAQLPAVRRVLAHLPTAMVFDDHDISDDWNLNREWEEVVYQHPFSCRMIGNGLIAYLINQGWGNAPEQFAPPLLASLGSALRSPGGPGYDELVETMLGLHSWDFQWRTEPPLVVLDTRTRRWRSESSARKPSGLLDWEALTDLQHHLRGQQAVILVSAAPIFGVKLIEVVQRLFTLAGYPLVVDAENWMAHPGTANGILNVFRHRNTPQHFVVLSGDVHYSFVYDVELRGRHRGPDIWQICSSGIRNAFPERLLDLLDRLNRVLYSPRSPLNWFTRRRRMRVVPRKPTGVPHGRRLLNQPGIGRVVLDPEGCPLRIEQLTANGDVVNFERREQESRWD